MVKKLSNFFEIESFVAEKISHELDAILISKVVQPKNCTEWIKGTADHMMPLGAWLYNLGNKYSIKFMANFLGNK